ncbi:putative spermidine/putrescine transport system substrate-binding protein/putrescine transport system substrate-binding protein [Neisseria sp. HSC-16F19]|nr:polyamine ABC transporter substrate-binding protein [Neisseria sp. HSC-16F19]MCP2039823.1 putative spermidine/putrescine transport system substrate-binding protein/putrescine transport system substrate-binding protein [Neisseria sp. HSC-16F19]
MTKAQLLMSACLGLALTACGGSNNAAAPAASQTPAASAEGASDTAAVSLPETDSLNIYNWSNYVDESTVTDFADAHNIKLNYDVYENNETLEAKVLTGNSGYDLVVPGIAFLPRQINAGAYQKVHKDLIPNYKNIDPELLKMLEEADPGNQYAVPYFSGVNTLAITAKGKELLGGSLPENEWDLLFKPEYTNKLKSCGIALWDTPSEMFPIVLNYLGKDPKGSNLDDIKEAAQVLEAIRPDVKRFSPSIIDELARGDVCLAAGNGGDLNMAKARSEEVKSNVGIDVLTPKGMGFWIEAWLIPADAKNVANAHKYINNTLDADVAAKNGNAVTFAPASMPAREKMDQQLVTVRSIFPNAEDMQAGFVMPQMGDDAKKLSVNLWQKLKVGSN